jgi:hypothetical protein
MKAAKKYENFEPTNKSMQRKISESYPLSQPRCEAPKLVTITNTTVAFYLYSCRWLPINGKENTLIFI